MTHQEPAATPTNDTPDVERTATVALRAAADKMESDVMAAAVEFEKELTAMRMADDVLTREIITGIVESLCLLSRRFDIPYSPSFPHLAIMAVRTQWEANAKQLSDYIEEGGARDGLDALDKRITDTASPTA